MSETLRTVRLYGVAGAKFGRMHRLAVSSTREAVRALCVIVPGFEKFLMNAKDNGLTFAVFNGRRNLDEEGLAHPVGADEIRIAPILIGSKSSGIFQTILGAALVVVGAVASAYGQAWGANVIALGASMMLGGVMQMLSPQTSTSSNDAGNGASYYFGGAVNSSAEGDPVPTAYGWMRVGSKVISSGIYAEDQA
ncbi:Phage-related protein, tail component [Paraburkholderia fungorum]|uniref:Phage-related protein, tail component n=1 Tax=Paraburkholderia fungorum TaxID=134537 RepID=A0A1H1H1E0_9BURK|nr:tail assembly protein [Paraburkholderia fungorum]SDR19240.1 Phage-related protein, tail component [Paraburkholderia fungorum]